MEGKEKRDFIFFISINVIAIFMLITYNYVQPLKYRLNELESQLELQKEILIYQSEAIKSQQKLLMKYKE